jgi:hypothetical protein
LAKLVSEIKHIIGEISLWTKIIWIFEYFKAKMLLKQQPTIKKGLSLIAVYTGLDMVRNGSDGEKCILEGLHHMDDNLSQIVG